MKIQKRHYKIKPVLSRLVILLGLMAFIFVGTEVYKSSNVKNTNTTPLNQTESKSLNISSPNVSPSPKAVSDPIVNCGPGVNSGQYVKDKQSVCKNYVDCGLNGNTVWTMMLKSECDKKQAEANSKPNNNTNISDYTSYDPYYEPYQTNIISCYVPEYKKTYRVTSEDCKDFREQAKKDFTSPTPLIEPPVATTKSYDDPVCQNIRSQWESTKAQINSSSYSSSAEQAVAYISWRDTYDNTYSGSNCPGYLN